MHVLGDLTQLNWNVAAGALPAAHVLNKAPEALAGALLRRPFVTLLNTMSDPNLPLTVSEYAEWGDPSGEGIPELWAAISPHKAITHSTSASAFACVVCIDQVARRRALVA